MLVRHPEAKILFSRPTGYGQILDLVEAHAYQISVRAGELVPLEEATADWYETEYLPAITAVHEAELPQAYEHHDEGRHLPLGAGQVPRAADDDADCDLGRCSPCRAPGGCPRTVSSGHSGGRGGGPFRGGANLLGSTRPPGPQPKPSTRHGRDPLEPARYCSRRSRRTTDGVLSSWPHARGPPEPQMTSRSCVKAAQL